jgi:hypothetical protein
MTKIKSKRDVIELLGEGIASICGRALAKDVRKLRNAALILAENQAKINNAFNAKIFNHS